MVKKKRLPESPCTYSKDGVSMKSRVIVVSGLPRSGTSMMMKMLEAGGLELIFDGKREADIDNPKGYFEFEEVKKTRKDSSWANHADGKGIKVISLLLYHLPPTKSYKILFMERHIREILASQRKMLERSGKHPDGAGDAVLTEKFEEHLRKIRGWIDKQPNIDCLYLNYREMIENPLLKSREVAAFLQKDLDVDAMAHAVDGALYRNRYTRMWSDGKCSVKD